MINLFKSINHFLWERVEEGQLPGAVYGIVTKDNTIYEKAIGYAHIKKQIPMSIDTLFDLASLTKVCVTLPSILLLIQKGEIDLDDSIKRFFNNTFTDKITIKHLLTHTSGLPAHIPFYKYGWSKETICDYIIGNNFEVGSETKPGHKVVYSDLNFILLGFLIEKITGQALDAFAYENIFKPLGMGNTTFNPKINRIHIAPTEWSDAINDYRWGEVHDENAAQIGGVSGHAGLFSNLGDLKIFTQMLLRRGYTAANNIFLSPSLIDSSRKNYTSSLNLNRGLGWQLVDSEFSPVGYFLSNNCYGHTGFTGTSLWIDPDRGIGIILLSNRVHIGRSINMNRIRRVFHNLVSFAIDKVRE
ncbi:serine hydrolase domain-containing protein [Tuberibacillus calidus]|jgi:CubicO group peptidase (beta-lactamase class C family)|uniref:serine hydrolase domain-containing protein n=1 Tax=Tuberibacillus calidus TaxID=340097 RepID=UPI00040E02D7|nr:serine hydrolase domain-containing protein [Tuberibacillus calidus]